MAKVACICLTGAESTGKSRLAEELARHFEGSVCFEFARDYVLEVKRPLTADDVEPIARGQMRKEDEATINCISDLLLLDTDLVSTVAYARYYYGECPKWIERAARARLADVYLFLDIDVPWIEDDARDAGADRELVHEHFQRVLDEFGANYVLIRGDWDERRAAAIAAIQAAR